MDLSETISSVYTPAVSTPGVSLLAWQLRRRWGTPGQHHHAQVAPN